MKISKKMLLVLISVLILTTSTFTSGCLGKQTREPTIELSEISIKEVSFGTTTLEAEAILNNPNPIGANLDKITYNLYFHNDEDDEGDWEFLASGEQNNISIEANGNTTIYMPLRIDNMQALMAAFMGFQRESMTFKVNGSAFFDLKIISYEVPFERVMVMSEDDMGLESVSLNFAF